MPTPTLTLTSFLSPNQLYVYTAIGDYLGRSLGMKTQTVASGYDPLDDPTMLDDSFEIAFICGLPLTRYNRAGPAYLIPLVAPVMQPLRYAGQPIYYSDVIVNAVSTYRTFADLRGSRLCYNDPGSNSGYNMLRHHLITSGNVDGFFSESIASGSHLKSIGRVATGQSDCAAIDSSVLEQAIRDDPGLAVRLRIVESLGPMPMPPIAVSQHLDEALIERIRAALLQAHEDATLRIVLTQATMLRLAPVQIQDYLPIEAMYEVGIRSGARITR